jgi:dihydroxyacetone kinase-like predicted kinase
VLVKKILGDGADFLTLLKGEGLAQADLDAIVDEIRDLGDEVEIEVRDGGQPLYPLQLVAE